MYIYNISFVIPKGRADAFMGWARTGGAVECAHPALKSVSLIKVAGIPGDPEFAKQPDRTYSLQMEFETLADCRRWQKERWQPLMDSYAEWHGPNPLFFATILQRYGL